MKKKKKAKKAKPEIHKIRRWALRSKDGSVICLRKGAKIPFTPRDLEWRWPDSERALDFKWLLLYDREQALWYRDAIQAAYPGKGFEMDPVRIDVTIAITPGDEDPENTRWE